MSLFLYTENTVTNKLLSGVEPWDFKPTEKITEQIRKVKEDRQAWYQNPDTKHYFYTLTEPLNSQLRVSKDHNPPHLFRGFVGDYDIACPRETIMKAIEAMKYKPSWLEHSLGGNFRLIFLLEEPMRVHDFNFAVFLLQKARVWLNLTLLPVLDEPAFDNPTRLLCRGDLWEDLKHPPIKARDSQYFFVQTAKEYKFKPTESDQIPLNIVEKALKEKYSTFEWPDEFVVNSQGPSHWFVPGSTSPMSSVVKQGGITCYSAHAEKGFYTWADLLGADFVKDYLSTAYTQATLDCWHDGRDFFRRIHGKYEAVSESSFRLYLRVECKLSAKPGPDGISPIDQAMHHVQSENRVASAGSFVFQKPGLINFQGERRLNNYRRKPIEPATGTQKWGPHGGAPFCSFLLQNLFAAPVSGLEEHIQLPWMLAWMKYVYMAAIDWNPLPGHRLVMCGPTGAGKTLLNREIIGIMLGGYADATNYLVKGEQFNAYLMDVAYWCVDDEVPANTPGARAKVAAMLKKVTAQSGLISNEKFRKQALIDWCGRVGMTLNMDFESMRILTASLDNNSMDKMCLFRCQSLPGGFKFPSRPEIQKILAVELPVLGRLLVDYKLEDHVEAAYDARFGFLAFHDELMVERGHQTSPSAMFRELLVETLRLWCQDNPDAACYSGTTSAIIRMINLNGNQDLMRGYKPDQINRFLEQLQTEKFLQCTVHTAADKTRVWTFQRVTTEAPTHNPTTGVSFESTGPVSSEVK